MVQYLEEYIFYPLNREISVRPRRSCYWNDRYWSDDKLYEIDSTLLFGETSEVTGGEHLIKQRCANDAVADQFMFMFNRYQDMIERFKTDDLSESQPTKGNIEGGLTTIEEKALGNIQKIGQKCHFIRKNIAKLVIIL